MGKQLEAMAIILPPAITGPENFRPTRGVPASCCLLGPAATCLISILVCLLCAVVCLVSFVLCVPPTPFCLERAVVFMLPLAVAVVCFLVFRVLTITSFSWLSIFSFYYFASPRVLLRFVIVRAVSLQHFSFSLLFSPFLVPPCFLFLASTGLCVSWALCFSFSLLFIFSYCRIFS